MSNADLHFGQIFERFLVGFGFQHPANIETETISTKNKQKSRAKEAKEAIKIGRVDSGARTDEPGRWGGV